MPRRETVIDSFQCQLQDPADLSVPVATIQALTEFIGSSQGMGAPGWPAGPC